MSGADPHSGRRIEPCDIPITPRDVHVPLGCMTQERRDLQAAAKLLIILGDNLSQFNYDKYPGGLWHEEDSCLYIPLPSWAGAAKRGDLAALKPLIEDLRSRMGFVQSIRLVCLDAEDVQPDAALCHELLAQVKSMMRLTHFALGNALSWANLEDLKGGPHASVA